METIPYAFIDSVAHVCSDSSAVKFIKLRGKRWKAVGHTHKTKRLFKGVLFTLENNGINVKLYNGLGQSERVTHERLCKIDLRFLRIYHFGTIDSRSHKTEIPEDNVNLLAALLTRAAVRELTLVGFSTFSSRTHFLWKSPVESLYVDESFPKEIFEYHLLENPNLKFVEVSRGNYDLMRTIVESWRLDEMQDFEMTNKTQIELVDLGFEAKYTECRTLIRLFRPILVQMVLRAEKVKNGVAQSVRFVATCR